MSSSSTHAMYSTLAFNAAYLAAIAMSANSGLRSWLRDPVGVAGKV